MTAKLSLLLVFLAATTVCGQESISAPPPAKAPKSKAEEKKTETKKPGKPSDTGGREASSNLAPAKQPENPGKEGDPKAGKKADKGAAKVDAAEDKAAAEKKAAQKKAAEKIAAEKKAAEKKAAEKKAAEKKAAEKKAAEKKAAEKKAAEKKAAAEKRAAPGKGMGAEKVTAREAKPPEQQADAKEKPARPIKLDPSWVSSFKWRSIGPASMGGRIVNLAVVESDPTTFYVATASGGLFKTTNNGTTFTALFQNENTVSIGDVCVSHSDPNIVWVGTGEHNGRNSVSWGDGVYKSSDSGRTWRNMGLKDSFQIGRIAIHPTNPDIVYVGALGRLWGENKERGVYKTIDGGKTWKQALFVDEKTGCVEIAMHPRDPDTLIIAMYERQRNEFCVGDPVKRWGPGGGLYKTSDGGATWKKLTSGLPKRPLGRIGVAYYVGNPNTVYAIVESDKIGDGPATAYMGITGSGQTQGAALPSVVKDGPAAKAGLREGDQVLEIDGEKVGSYNEIVVRIRRHKPGEKSKIKFKRGEEEKTVEITWGKRPGSASSRPFSASLGGQRANAQKEQGEKGNDTGGIYKSTDGGESWVRINSLNPRPFYYSQIRVDPSDDRYLYVLGIQLHQSINGGSEFKTSGSRVHPDHHAMWINPRDGRHLILGCDGGLYVSYDRGAAWDFHDIVAIGQFYDVGVDTRNPYRAYGGLQDNGSWGGPTRKRGTTGPVNADWVRLGGGDGFLCRADPNDPDTVYYEMQYGRMSRVNLRTGERASIRAAAPKGERNRFNWKTPFLLSRHNSRIFYCAGSFVFRSLDRGSNLQPISPTVTRTDRGSATALAESPRDPNVLYVGTDDGELWVTRDGGHEWTSVVEKIKLPGHFHVSSIETSRYETGRAYVAFDGHRSNNDDPHVYVTEDFGQTWKSLNASLPIGSTRVLREDASNRNLLYLGTEFAIWASMDRGGNWTKVNNNLPTVAIHEIAVHPEQAEIVAATHGRSLWILDVTPLRQLTDQVAAADAHLFKSQPGVLWAGALSSSRSGHRNFAGQNPSFGSALYYFLGADVKKASLEIRDIRGNLVRQLKADNKAGLHRVEWNLRADAPSRGSRSQSRSGSFNRKELFQRLDANKDGKLTSKEAPEGRVGASIRQLIERGDRNKDGALTLAEFTEAPLPRAGGSGTSSRRSRVGPAVSPGTYLAKLTIDDKEFSQEIKVEADPEFPAAMLLEELEQFDQKQRPVFIE